VPTIRPLNHTLAAFSEQEHTASNRTHTQPDTDASEGDAFDDAHQRVNREIPNNGGTDNRGSPTTQCHTTQPSIKSGKQATTDGCRNRQQERESERRRSLMAA